MSEGQIRSIATRAELLEFSKARVSRAEKAIAAAYSERQAAEMEVGMRLKEYQDACHAAISLSSDPTKGPGPQFFRS